MLRSADNLIRSSGTPRSCSAARREPHHRLGTAHERDRVRRVELRACDEVGHHADVTVPARPGSIDGDLDVDACVGLRPLLEVVGEHDLDPACARRRAR